MEQYIDEFGNLQYRPSYTGINGINMGQLNVEPYKSIEEMRGQPENRSFLDQGLPFALPNLNYRNYDLSNLFNTTEPDLNNSALARRLMTQPGLDKFTGINKGVYDPYGIKVEDGRFSYDMNKTSLADYQKPKNRFTGMDTSYGVANEPDDTQSQEYIDQVKKSQGGGIGGLLKFLVGLAVPGAGFLMNLPGRGLEGIRSLNQRIQGSDFGQATSMADYLDMRKYGGLQGRRDASARTMAQARGLQKEMAQRPSAIGGGGGGGGQDMGASVSRSAAATRSRDLGSMRGGVGR